MSTTVYSLMGLEELIVTKKGYGETDLVNIENPQKQEFLQVFLQKNGFAYLQNLFCQHEKQNLETNTLRTKALTVLLKLLAFIFN